MKYILILLLLASCGKTTHKKTKPITKTASQTKKSNEIKSSQEKTFSNPTSVSLEGITKNEEQYCVITFPQSADSLSQFQVSVKITVKQKNITVHSLTNITVLKDNDKPNIYYSESTPSISLEFQSGNVVYFTMWENGVKKHSCAFNQ